MADEPGRGARAARFFFLHLGSLLGIVAYFVVFENHARSETGVRLALLTALAVHGAYMALARRFGELKQFDIGFALLFLLGALAVFAAVPGAVSLFQVHSAALVFATFALTALLPPLFGGEPFTAHVMRRTLPAWQRRLPVTGRIGEVMWRYWIAIFATATGLALWAPHDPLFTALYPNLLIIGLGLTAQWWLPRLYLKLFPPEPLDTVEPMIMGMPLVFDPRAAGGVRAVIHFCINGDEAGDYWLRIAGGRCHSFEGRPAAADVTVRTTGPVWRRIVLGEIDGAQAVTQGLLEVQGNGGILAHLSTWFPSPRRSAA